MSIATGDGVRFGGSLSTRCSCFGYLHRDRRLGDRDRPQGSGRCSRAGQRLLFRHVGNWPAEKSGESQIDFIEADSQALPFPDDTFGCVTVAFGLRNVADTDQGIREMARVCRPGGQVLILEFSQPQLWGLRQVYGFYFRNVLPQIGQWFAKNDKSAYEYLPESVGQFPDGKALADRMTAVGLQDVRYHAHDLWRSDDL